ncbi:hypothetical protein SBADM41S_06167 [Streptomyces badius]
MPSCEHRTRSPLRYQRRPRRTVNAASVRAGSPRYPGVRPIPAMRSSPASPGRSVSPPGPTTSTSVPDTGRPMGSRRTRSAGRSPMMWQLVLMVASVGPYRLAMR